MIPEKGGLPSAIYDSTKDNSAFLSQNNSHAVLAQQQMNQVDQSRAIEIIKASPYSKRKPGNVQGDLVALTNGLISRKRLTSD